jgi:hypothetical protein
VAAPLVCGTAALAVTGGAVVLVDGGSTSARATTASLRLPTEATPDAAPVVGPGVALVEPVTAEPRVFDAADLVKGVRLAEEQALARAREQARPPAAQASPRPAPRPSVTRSDCGISTTGLGAVKPHVRAAAQFLGCRFGEPTMYGVAGRAGTSDHPSGKAVDFMVDPATGDRLAACALKNRAALGITYVIWQQRINFGSGWQPMEDRGGVTANHFDHVHVSFGAAAGGSPNGC